MSLGELVLDRRRFLELGILSLLAGFAPHRVFGAVHPHPPPKRSLSFYNTHTEESLDVAYCVQGRYASDGLKEVDYILRDHRTGEIKAIDTRLLDLLYAISRRLQARSPFHVISGYRSPSTNAMLCKRGSGVVKNSLHVQGKAIDIRLPDCDLSVLRRVAMDLKGGGVGYYRSSDFVHVDVGRVRYW